MSDSKDALFSSSGGHYMHYILSDAMLELQPASGDQNWKHSWALQYFPIKDSETMIFVDMYCTPIEASEGAQRKWGEKDACPWS